MAKDIPLIFKITLNGTISEKKNFMYFKVYTMLNAIIPVDPEPTTGKMRRFYFPCTFGY